MCEHVGSYFAAGALLNVVVADGAGCGYRIVDLRFADGFKEGVLSLVRIVGPDACVAVSL